MFLIPLWLVLVLQYLTNTYFMVLSTLVLIMTGMTGLLSYTYWSQLYTDVCMVIYGTWASSTDMADFDLPQTFPIPTDVMNWL